MASKDGYEFYVPETQPELDLNNALVEDEEDHRLFITPNHINEKDSDSEGSDILDPELLSSDFLLDITTVPSSCTPLKGMDELVLSPNTTENNSISEINAESSDDVLPDNLDRTITPCKVDNSTVTLGLPPSSQSTISSDVPDFNLQMNKSLEQFNDPLSSSDEEYLLSAVIPSQKTVKTKFKSVSSTVSKPVENPVVIDADLLDFKSQPRCPFVNSNTRQSNDNDNANLTSHSPQPTISKVDSTSTKSKSRFHKSNPSEVAKLQLDSKAERTQKQTRWGVNIFKDWCAFSGVNPEFEQLTSGELGILMKNFFAEVRQSDGSTYSRSSLLCIRASLARYLTGPPFNRPINIMTDADFIPMNAVVSGTIKNKKKDGEDTSERHPDITTSDIQLMYSTRTLSNDNPRSLLYKTFFELSLHFGRRGREGLRDLKKQHIIFKQDSNGNEYSTLSFHPFEKNHTGASQLMYSTGGPDCPISSLKFFISKLHPDCDALLQKPKVKNFENSSIWYNKSPLGLNSIGQLMANISKAAGTSIRYTNHCIRATAVTSLRAAGKQAIDIKAVTGHKSISSIDSYSSVSDEQRMDMSHKLSKFLGKAISNEGESTKEKPVSSVVSRPSSSKDISNPTVQEFAATGLSVIEEEHLSPVKSPKMHSDLSVIHEEQLSQQKPHMKGVALVKPSPRKLNLPTRSSPRLKLKYGREKREISSKKMLFPDDCKDGASSLPEEDVVKETEQQKSSNKQKSEGGQTIIIQSGSTVHIHYH